MDFKIIDLSHANFPNVLVRKAVSEDADYLVNLELWGKRNEEDEDEEDGLLEETVAFSNVYSAENFIKDYSEESAISWCIGNNISHLISM